MPPTDYTRARRALMRSDPVIAALIRQHGECGLASAAHADPFHALFLKGGSLPRPVPEGVRFAAARGDTSHEGLGSTHDDDTHHRGPRGVREPEIPSSASAPNVTPAVGLQPGLGRSSNAAPDAGGQGRSAEGKILIVAAVETLSGGKAGRIRLATI